MPPNRQILKEAILEKAFDMTRSCGFPKLTARKLAAALGCSTQPIFHAFADMKELELETAKRAYGYMLAQLTNAKENDAPKELVLVLSYIRFALEEKNLFQLIASNGLFESLRDTSFDSSSPIDPRLIIFANGIVFMAMFGTIDMDWPSIHNMVDNASRAFLEGKGSET